MSTILVIAPHPDDETLGCGGTLLRHASEGAEIHWLIVTAMTAEGGFTPERMRARKAEIERVAEGYGFVQVHELGLPTARLDTFPMLTLVQKVGAVVESVRPSTMYLPYPGDAHTDHAATFDAASACTKWFRYPHLRRILAYETPSETEFGLDPDTAGFRPNTYIDVSQHLDEKIRIMKLYQSEMGEFPFPRSEHALRALAHVRGAAAGFEAAEAFMLLKERS